MAIFLTILGGIILVFINALFNGFVIMEAYELAFSPFLTYFCEPSIIPFMVFVLVGLGINLCRPQSESKYKITDKEYWQKWLSIICTKLLLILIIWIFNIVLL